MQSFSTTTMSSKGQGVIPEDVREVLGLAPGTQFLVIGENDVVILKTISRPSMKDFNSIIRRARRQAKADGLKRSDVPKAIAKVRGRR